MLDDKIGRRIHLRIGGSRATSWRDFPGGRAGYVSEHPAAAPVEVRGILERVDRKVDGWVDLRFAGLDVAVYLTALTPYAIEVVP